MHTRLTSSSLPSQPTSHVSVPGDVQSNQPNPALCPCLGRLHRWTPMATPPGCTEMASQPLHFWYQALFLQKTHEECGNVRHLSTWLISSTGKKQSKIIIIIKKKTAHNRAVQMLFFPRLVTELHTDLRSYGFSFFFATWKRKVLSPFPKLFLFCYNF